MMQGVPGMDAGMYAEDDQWLDNNDLGDRNWEEGKQEEYY